MHQRRKWTASKKQAVLAQRQPGEKWSDLAKRLHINPSQLYEWRRLGLGTPDNRKPAKRSAKPTETVQATVQFHIPLHYCPTCGMGLDTVAAALTKAS